MIVFIPLCRVHQRAVLPADCKSIYGSLCRTFGPSISRVGKSSGYMKRLEEAGKKVENKGVKAINSQERFVRCKGIVDIPSLLIKADLSAIFELRLIRIPQQGRISLGASQ